ncbi:MAG: glutamate-5-semialdehyde dehydrogenase [Spirochaetes bacterium GWB1_36_13]|nr:MAG: glutamate-5-semialdehyde dehydrogenase [Spirochaetes bacterium GWB1_36_13]
MDFKKYLHDIADKSRNAFYQLQSLKTGQKNLILKNIAQKLEKNRVFIQSENLKDMENAKKNNLSTALLDRLLLNDKRIDGMIESLNAVIALDDPVGEITESRKNNAGLLIAKQRIPIGVIGMVYESRPNVAIEASSLSIKSGNAIILRGGSEAIHSNKALGKLIHEGIKESGFDENMVAMIDITDREVVNEMIKAEKKIDLIIPRGGESLIRFVVQNSLIPVIKHDKGVCSVFVNDDAKKEMAEAIAVNAKVQRPGVCNAIENLYLHKDYPYKKEILKALTDQGVKLKAYQEAADYSELAEKIDDINEFSVEYLDLILSVKIVDSLDEAVDMIRKYGSEHSDAIITERYQDAMKFLNTVNSSSVYVNASTRFTDGFEFGLGGEIGISTNKLHARGPMALKELTTYKYIIMGEGQIR